MKFVSIIMGSKSDYEIVSEAAKTLEKFGVKYELIISSAHRSPKRTSEYVANAEKKGAKVFIAAAGMAAHLAGAIAANTTKPVIGIPMAGSALSGVDALYSTVQMPSGMPVATLAIGKAGAINAAYLAVQILALEDEGLASALKADREAKIKALEEDSSKVEVCKLVHLEREVIEDMINRGVLKTKEENGEILIEASEGTMSVVPSVSQNLSLQPQSQDGFSFVEKTIGTILNLHEKVLDAKDETLETLRNENKFLKEALISMQELYDEDRKTVETLTKQLKISQDEVEFLKRKYKLMWNQAVENFNGQK